jgi:hypothetical protein
VNIPSDPRVDVGLDVHLPAGGSGGEESGMSFETVDEPHAPHSLQTIHRFQECRPHQHATALSSLLRFCLELPRDSSRAATYREVYYNRSAEVSRYGDVDAAARARQTPLVRSSACAVRCFGLIFISGPSDETNELVQGM